MAFAIAACSGGGAARKRDSEGRVLPTLAEQDPTGTLYAKSVSDAARGECDERTLDVLTCFSYRGHGYEGAQTALGQCLIATGDNTGGLDWIHRAADAGWPDAQKLLAQILLAGDVATRDGVEAAKWAKLYSRNPSLLSLGVQPDRDLALAFQGEITSEQNTEADRRVAAWVPRYWAPTSQVDQRVQRSCEVEGRRPPPTRQDVPLITVPEVY
ncbi:MAG: hypothetical protein WD671_02835 [Parvibaculum sp.]